MKTLKVIIIFLVVFSILIPSSAMAVRKVKWKIPENKTQEDYNYEIYTCMSEGRDIIDSYNGSLRFGIVGLPELKTSDITIKCRERVIKCMKRKGYEISNEDEYYYVYSDVYKIKDEDR